MAVKCKRQSKKTRLFQIVRRDIDITTILTAGRHIHTRTCTLAVRYGPLFICARHVSLPCFRGGAAIPSPFHITHVPACLDSNALAIVCLYE